MGQTSKIIANVAKEGRKYLLETEAKTMRMEYALPVTKFKFAKTEAVDFAEEMLTEIKAYRLLKGYRNTPPADTETKVKILLNTSKLVMDHREIKELDLNPIMVYEKGAKTIDARIILE